MNFQDDFGSDEGVLSSTASPTSPLDNGPDFAFIGLIVGVTLASIVFSAACLICCFKMSRQNQPKLSPEITPQELEMSRKIPIRDDSLASDVDGFKQDEDSLSELTLHSVTLPGNS